MAGLHVAVVGATGLVGREMIAVLAERGFPVARLRALASPRSAGTFVDFQGERVRVETADAAAFAGVDLVLMSAGSQASAELAPAARAAGAILIDNSSHWRMHADVPLVVPEVNADAAGTWGQHPILANPNCATIQMMVALQPLHQAAGLRRLLASTYQAVSGRGQAGMDELSEQVQGLYNHQETTPKVFAKRIAFNCLPQIDAFADDGSTLEEVKLCQESRKILGLPELRILATCVRVPVFNGHAVALVAEFDRPLTPEQARTCLKTAPGVVLQDDPKAQDYPTPVDAAGEDATFVGRVRADPSVDNGLALWVVADNLRKGAATNAVQIAEVLLRSRP